MSVSIEKAIQGTENHKMSLQIEDSEEITEEMKELTVLGYSKEFCFTDKVSDRG